MNIVLDSIKPETLAFLESEAKRLRMSVDEYLRRLLPIDERELALRADVADDEFERDMEVFAERTTPQHTYTGTYSREDIYSDHD